MKKPQDAAWDGTKEKKLEAEVGLEEHFSQGNTLWILGYIYNDCKYFLISWILNQGCLTCNLADDKKFYLCFEFIIRLTSSSNQQVTFSKLLFGYSVANILGFCLLTPFSHKSGWERKRGMKYFFHFTDLLRL